MPDLDHLLKVFGPAPSSSARSPSPASASVLSPRASGAPSGSYSYSQSRQRSSSSSSSSRRRPPAAGPFSSPLAGNMNTAGLGGGGGGGGESLLDVSGISGIAGDNECNFNDSDLFRAAGGGGSSGGRLNLDGDYGNNNGNTSLYLGVEDGGRSQTAWQRPRPGTTAKVPSAAAVTSLGLGRGGEEGPTRTPGRSSSTVTDSFVLRNGGAGGENGRVGNGGAGGENGRVGYGAGRIGGMVGVAGGQDVGLSMSREWNVKVDDLEDEKMQQLIAEAQAISSDPAADEASDVQDVRCLCLHQPLLLRGSQGRYMQVSKEEEAGEGDLEDFDDNASTITAISGDRAGGAHGGAAGDLQTLFGVDAEGTGTGDPAEVVHFVSAAERGARGPIVYGQSVSVKSLYGKGKYLRVSSSGAAIFARIHSGPAERWTILPCRTTAAGAASASKTGGVGGARADVGRVGGFVRKGERIELEHTEFSGARKGAKTSLMMRPREYGNTWEVGAGRREEHRGEEYESFEILPAGVPYLPPWRRNRPYLTRDFLLDPPPRAPSRAVAELFGIEPGDPVLIDYDRQSSVGGSSGLGRSGDVGSRGRQGEAGAGERAGGGAMEALPEAMQEELLLEDLLYALMGFAGSYIVVRDDHVDEAPASLYELEFTVNVNGEAIDQSLVYLAERVLPLCNNYVRVNRFASERGQYEFGKVAHALAAGMQRLLREYLVLVAQLENQLLQGKLSLQRLWFYVQPSMRTMEALEALTVELKDLRGGAILRRLRIMGGAGGGGDEASRQLHTFLLHQASVPYMEMLETWIYHGDLNDQYGEFMIEQAEDVHKQDVGQDFNTRYWSGRYLLRPQHVIASLAGRQDKILTTGKYLNVVRECGRRVDCPLAGPIPADPGDAGEGLYATVIDGAYGFASRCLMDLVVREGDLLPRLESIKHYFLLDRGDFFEHFLDCSEEELDKVIPQISVPRLESLLHLSVQMSSASQDPFKDSLGLEFASRNLLKQLELIHSHGGAGDPESLAARARAETWASSPAGREREGGAEYAERMIQGTAELRGVEGLMLSFKVRWPLSLVLSKKSLTKYQLLFRHLFFAKHVQRLLSKNSWREHLGTKQLELKGLMMASYHLRHRMLHFIQNLVYYMMVEVIEPQWHQFMDDLKKLCGPNGARGSVAGGGGDSGGDVGEEMGTLDDVLRRHEEFQDVCLKECLLTNVGLLKSLTRVMISCLHFGDQGCIFAAEWQSQQDAVRQEEEEEDREEAAAERERERLRRRLSSVGSGTVVEGAQGGRYGQRKGLSGGRRTEHLKRRSCTMRSALDTERYKEYIQHSREGFDASLEDFASHLWHDADGHYHSHLNNLCARLDYNEFFSKTSRRMPPP
eukprot:g14933.t1